VRLIILHSCRAQSLFSLSQLPDHNLRWMRIDLANWLSKYPDTVVLSDNASVHKRFRGREALNNVTNGRWVTVPEYSPQFSPIERGFANVWKFLQGMEPHRIQLDPLIALHDALFEYSADGPRGYTGKLSYLILTWIFIL
jgi:hypothetical protein